jgi:hypothetical protein
MSSVVTYQVEFNMNLSGLIVSVSVVSDAWYTKSLYFRQFSHWMKYRSKSGISATSSIEWQSQIRDVIDPGRDLCLSDLFFHLLCYHCEY